MSMHTNPTKTVRMHKSDMDVSEEGTVWHAIAAYTCADLWPAEACLAPWVLTRGLTDAPTCNTHVLHHTL